MAEMEQRVELNYLLDFYGPLLTEHRRELMRLYCEEDLSLAEIAEHTGITRQGVRDSIKHAEASLIDMEERLGVIRHAKEMRDGLGAIKALAAEVERVNRLDVPSLEITRLTGRISELAEKLAEESV